MSKRPNDHMYLDMLSLRTCILLEGRWEHESGLILRRLMKIITAQLFDPRLKGWPPEQTDVSSIFNDVLSTDIRCTLFVSRTDLETSVSGNWDPDIPGISIAVTLHESEGRGRLAYINQQLSEIVRHEIEHMIQAGVLGPRTALTASFEDGIGKNYRELSHEIESWAVGLYRTAKHTGRPFVDVLHASLDDPNLDHELRQMIFDRTIDYARRRFPKLR